MPRFTDEWVVDRTLFEFVQGGSCACCAFTNLFLPNKGVEGLIQEMTDLETDGALREVEALATSPWPEEVRTQVWSDRVKLRLLLKRELKDDYQIFWKQHGEDFVAWCHSSAKLHPKEWKKVLQLPRSEVTALLETRYGIHSTHAFSIVINAVMEQVANYAATKYPVDGVGKPEVDFEDALFFDRRGGFTMNIVLKTSANGVQSPSTTSSKTTTTTTCVNEATLAILLNRMQSLCGPKLLDRRVSSSSGRRCSSAGGGDGNDEIFDDDADDDNDADKVEGPLDDCDDITDTNTTAKPSFRSDRRIVRLLVARYFFDALRLKYFKYKREQEQAAEANETAINTTTINEQEQEACTSNGKQVEVEKECLRKE